MHYRSPKPNKNTHDTIPTYTVQLIDFTCCHDRFPEQALTHKHTKYDPLINTLQTNGWKTNPLITTTAGVTCAIHEHSIGKLTNLKIPNTSIKTLMKNLHQHANKYLTYLVLNKKKTRQQTNPYAPTLIYMALL